MRLPHFAAAACLASATAVLSHSWDLPSSFDRYAPLASKINWEPCRTEGYTPVECGRFEVPMDYKNPSAGKASLAVARARARKSPRLGTLFMNPGGPGESGFDYMRSGGATGLLGASGDQYDVVSWDPRGVGSTFPRADCFASWKEKYEFTKGTILEYQSGIEIRGGGKLSDEDIINVHDQIQPLDDALTRLNGECKKYNPDVMEYVGTVATVRDMVALSDYLEGPDQPINYWGFSYGTAIGLYFANMYPKRVRRLVLDGVIDPEFWAQRPAHEFWSVSITGAKVSLDGFIKECVAAGPQKCAFTNHGDTEKNMYDRVLNLLDRAYDYKHNNKAARLGSATIRNTLLGGMYSPRKWAQMATQLAGYDRDLARATGNASLILSSSQRLRMLEPSVIDDESNGQEAGAMAGLKSGISYAFQAITCADAIDSHHITTETVMFEIIASLQAVDRIFGPKWGDAGFYCHRWKPRAVERYTGPWDNRPANKILVIGNEGDPITPLDPAKIVAATYGPFDAALVEQDNYGHTSFAMHSDCTLQVVKDYFIKNELPGPFVKTCGTNDKIFAKSDQLEADDSSNHAGRPRMIYTFVSALGLAVVYLLASYIRGRKSQTAIPAPHWRQQMSEKGDAEKGRQGGLVG